MQCMCMQVLGLQATLILMGNALGSQAVVFVYHDMLLKWLYDGTNCIAARVTMLPTLTITVQLVQAAMRWATAGICISAAACTMASQACSCDRYLQDLCQCWDKAY